MQIFISQSKHFILTVLLCSLLFTWTSTSYIEVTVLSAATEQSPSVKSVESIWSSMSRELKLDHQAQSSPVRAEIRKLLADRNDLRRILKAAGPYIYYIYKQTQARGLPAELALIPVIESEFNPNDHSNKGATGLWQLMPGTAHELGVKIKAGYDGRRNVLASTKAALAYFNDLGNMFKGNWYLAIAAYNCGQARIFSAIHRTGSHSFWNLPLPKETKYYVPKLLAVAEILKHPEKYGVQLPPVNNKPYFTEVKVAKAMDLAQMAKSSGISLTELRTLNPDYNHGMIAQKNGYSLLIPVNKLPALKAQYADRIVKIQDVSTLTSSRTV